MRKLIYMHMGENTRIYISYIRIYFTHNLSYILSQIYSNIFIYFD